MLERVQQGTNRPFTPHLTHGLLTYSCHVSTISNGLRYGHLNFDYRGPSTHVYHFAQNTVHRARSLTPLNNARTGEARRCPQRV